MNGVSVLQLRAAGDDIFGAALDLGAPEIVRIRIRHLVQAGQDLARERGADRERKLENSGQKLTGLLGHGMGRLP